ncbi:RORAB-like protein [Mya arenaria]|uniref:RORAB-like protein n=1 Tax=Mya arenaria TaxID=6604 RepID=A0ABY7DWR0_MYAAR|nr:RORAB-like protein [Mya arenaria]
MHVTAIFQAFFRRSLVQKKENKCKRQSSCDVTSKRSGNCAPCRLARCRKLGMCKEGVRKGRFSLPMRTQAINEANMLEGKLPVTSDDNSQPSTPESSSSGADSGICESPGSSSGSSDTSDTMLVPYGCNVAMDTDMSLVAGSMYDQLLTSLVTSQESIYPDLKKYFEMPLDALHKDIHNTLTLKEEIYEGVFGSSAPMTTEQFQDIFATTGNDVDSRLQQFEMYGRSMEDGIRLYHAFAERVPGLPELCPADRDSLIKAGHLEFWFFGSHMLFNKKLGIAMCYDGSQTGSKAHMTRFFDADWIDLNFDFADTLSRLQLSFEEIVLIRAIILTSADRCTLTDRGTVQTLQERYLECMRRHLAATCRQPSKRLFRIIERLVAARNMNEINLQLYRLFYLY